MIDTLIAAWGASLRRHWMAWLLGSMLIFVTFPGLDLTVSSWYWDSAAGWRWGSHPLAEFVRKGLPALVIGAAVFVLFLYVAGKVLKQRFWGVDGWVATYILSSLLIGPGLLTNELFKAYWHRARPSQIEPFGGQAHFTPPFMITDQCATNCSFVSGHAAMGFWVVAFAFLVPPPWRGRAIALALGFGAIVGWVRIIQGGHFLSDVVYAGLLVVAVTWGLWRTLVASPRSPQRPGR